MRSMIYKPTSNAISTFKHYVQKQWLTFIRKYWYGPNWRADCRNKRPVMKSGELLYQRVKEAGERRRAHIRLEHLRTRGRYVNSTPSNYNPTN